MENFRCSFSPITCSLLWPCKRHIATAPQTLSERCLFQVCRSKKVQKFAWEHLITGCYIKSVSDETLLFSHFTCRHNGFSIHENSFIFARCRFSVASNKNFFAEFHIERRRCRGDIVYAVYLVASEQKAHAN